MEKMIINTKRILEGCIAESGVIRNCLTRNGKCDQYKKSGCPHGEYMKIIAELHKPLKEEIDYDKLPLRKYPNDTDYNL